MPVGTLREIYENMERGIYNFTKNGECSNCGACCSSFLPLSKKEIKRITEYVKKHNIKAHRHMSVLAKPVDIDGCCPFLDERKEHKCDIYEVRPDICKHFVCNVPPSKAEADKARFWAIRQPVNMWELVR